MNEKEYQAAGNLLALIHRDGGHYLENVGFLNSCKDAEHKIISERMVIAEYERRLILLLKSLDTATRIKDHVKDSLFSCALILAKGDMELAKKIRDAVDDLDEVRKLL